MFVKIFYSILCISAGFGMLKYRRTVYEWTGRWAWAEKYLGTGGTITALSLVAIGLLFFGITYPFGIWDNAGGPRGIKTPSSETSQTSNITNQ